ncbi:MAG: protein kinase [Myxococcales bacterium]|nr:protein kinase [Myxococcales bacterium]
MSTPAPIRLGPFHLSGRLAAGGFGVVWRGEHEGEGLPVAAKVMTGARVRRARYAEAFRNEVRAAAGLDHPGIVAVYDYGEVDDAAAAASSHALAAGSPYLVMELAEHGSLADRPGPYPWPVVKGVLQSLLASLAYAHARGIVHRDMKPGNVLVSGPAHRPTLKLADFGIAFPMHADVDDDESTAATGTPRYMAPEQLRSAWRDFGPWTDLYGLACVAWQLLTGSPPFVRPGPLALMMAHLKDPVPPLSPMLGAPAGVEDWLRALLEKDPARRPRSAADAARALDALPGDPAPLPLIDPGPVAVSLEPTLDVIGGDDPTLVDTTRPRFDEPPPAGPTETTIPLSPMRAGPMPPWRRDTPLVPPAALRDAGLGLFGLRGLPLVGRDAERDALWAALRGACDTGLPGVIVLEGAAGIGKTRLGTWLGERAHEVGAARLLHAHHAAQPGPGDGITPMLARALRTAGLAGDALVERVARALEAAPADPLVVAVAALLAGEVTDDTSIRVRLQSPEERGVVVRRALARLAVERALVVLLDDAVWAPDTLGFVEQAMATQHPAPFPVLFVLTARSEALPERPAAAARLEALARPPRGRRVELGPLPADHQLTLVRELLGLETALAARVAERAAGNPQFAVQVVGDWVERGLIVRGEQGYRLADGADAELPADLQAAWDARVERLLADRPRGDALALELAAALGPAPDPVEWSQVCARANAPATPQLVDALLSVRLARAPDEGALGWRFAQGMFREALLRRARRAGRAAAHHMRCAEMLAASGDNGGADRPERLGRHLLAAGDPAAALGPLLVAARRHFETGAYARAQLCLAEREGALTALAVGPGDPRHAEGALLRCWIDRSVGDRAAAERRLAAVDAAVDGGAWPALRAQVDFMRGVLAFAGGQVAAARQPLREAERAFARLGDRPRLAHCRSELAKVLAQGGALDAATEALQAALTDFVDLGDARGEARCHLGLAVLARARGDLPGVEAALARARDGFDRAGARLGVAESLNQLGDCARLQGDSAHAVDLYREAIERFVELEAPSVDIARANLALALIDQGACDDARVHLDACVDRFARRGNGGLVGAMRVVQLLCDADAGDWAGYAAHLDEGRRLLAEAGYHDLDVARSARAAAEKAAGHPELVAATYTLARAQYAALGRHDDVAAIDALTAE